MEGATGSGNVLQFCFLYDPVNGNLYLYENIL